MEPVDGSASSDGSVCGMREMEGGGGGSKASLDIDQGLMAGPASDTEASCKISAGMGDVASAGFYSASVKQSGGNQGFAAVDDSELPVDFRSGKRYHFELTARISSVSPTLAPQHGGIPITVRGSGFGGSAAAIEATLGESACEVRTVIPREGFICWLPDRRDQFASVAAWEFESERGARWQWYYEATLGTKTLHPDVLAHASFPDNADGELILPIAQTVRRWNDNFVSRVSGWFAPPATVEYSFFARADDTALFYLNEGGAAAVRPSAPLINISTPLLQWSVEPQTQPIQMEAGKRYWYELLCSRSSEYTGFGTPEVDLNAATNSQDGYRMGRCDIGVRVHAPAANLPSGSVKGGAFELQQLLLLSSATGFTELGLGDCSQWVRINQTRNDGKPPATSDVEEAVKKLLPSVPHLIVTSERRSDHAFVYNVTYASAGTQGLLKARNYGIEWTAARLKPGGVDVRPVTGDMLIAPSIKRRPTVAVRVGNRTSAACGVADWEARRVGCFLRHQPRYTTSYANPDDVLVMNATVLSIGGMTLERCSIHCEQKGYAYFGVSQESGITQECGCLADVNTDDTDKFEPVLADACNAECASDAAQICGGRSVSLGERYASVYKTEDTSRSLHYAFAGATPEPQRNCRLDFWLPTVQIAGVFPVDAMAGDALFMLVLGYNRTTMGGSSSKLTVCGRECRDADFTAEERAGLLSNFSNGPWAGDIPLGIYEAETFLCRMPECEAGEAEALLYVSSAGFAKPGQIRAGLEVTSVARVQPLQTALREAATAVIGTPGGGAELQIDGRGFSTDAANYLEAPPLVEEAR